MSADFTGEALTVRWPERGIALVTMTRGAQMNTLTHALIDELNVALDRLQAAAPRALVITGTERAFCCGAHLRYFAGPDATLRTPFAARDGYLARIAETFDRLEETAYPVIAAVNGFALGGGCELALSCDMRVLSTSATLGLPEVRLGAIAGAGGVQKLIRHVGRSKALEWILRGAHLDAATVAAHGLAVDVVPPDALMPRALTLAIELRSRGRAAVAQSKRTIYASEDADLRTARRFGVEALSMLVGGDEWKEGMQAFVDKRPPRFDADV